jgi:hypothetical protein
LNVIPLFQLRQISSFSKSEKPGRLVPAILVISFNQGAETMNVALTH